MLFIFLHCYGACVELFCLKTLEDGMQCTNTAFQTEVEDQEIGVQYIRELGIYKTY